MNGKFFSNIRTLTAASRIPVRGMQSAPTGTTTKVPPIGPTSYFWPCCCCGLGCRTYLSSGSSFSSFVAVILTPPFLARGQPDKLKYGPNREQNQTMSAPWPPLLTLISFLRNGSILPSVGSIVSSHVPWTITTWGRTPGKHRNRALATWLWWREGDHDTCKQNSAEGAAFGGARVA